MNPVIYSELCYLANSLEEVETLMAELSLSYRELPRGALFLAAKAFQKYKRRGGTKSAPLPDFFIGAHAQASGLPILTRDVGRYRTYFPEVSLIAP